MNFMVSRHELWEERYSRQIRFAPVGAGGQQRLSESSVLIVGCGALGASLAQHMARAGVKELRIVDRDYVEPSNLQRQTLFDETDALQSLPKAIAAAAKLQKINSQVAVEPIVANAHTGNIDRLLDGMQLVLDGTDNAAARLMLSDRCFERSIPYVFGGVAGSKGMSALLMKGSTPCLRCLIGGEEALAAADTCDSVGVLSPAVEMVVSLQAAEAIKWLTDNKDTLHGSLVSIDTWHLQLRRSRLPAAFQNCFFCGDIQHASTSHHADKALERSGAGKRTRPLSIDREQSALLCGRDTIQLTLTAELELGQMQRRLNAAGCEVTSNRYLVKAVLPDKEKLVLFADGRVLVHGTDKVERAISLCLEYVIGNTERSGHL